MKRLALGVAILVAVGAFALSGSPIEPVSWDPPPPTAFDGPFTINDRLKDVQWWAKQLIGPEAMFVDDDGTIVTGLKDGRLVRLKPGVDEPVVLADTHGRPLAVAKHPSGRTLICDAHRGLLAMAGDGILEVLSAEHGGIPFKFTDDLTVAADGAVYFTDASARHSIDRFVEDLIEHQTSGRVLKWDPATKLTSLVAGGFSFPNGIALAPDESFLVVAETGAYQLWKLWLTGPKAGTRERFGATLPGFPDNVRWSSERKVFWVAIGSPRNGLIERLAHWPRLRAQIPKLPKFVQPGPKRHAIVAAVDLEGTVVESLQYRSPDSYSPVATALEHQGFLYLGSFAQAGLARLPLPSARPKSE